MVASLAIIFGWHGDGRGSVSGATARLADYVDHAIVSLAKRFTHADALPATLRGWANDIAALEPGQSLDVRPADLFYRLLAVDPFKTQIQREDASRNLAMLSQLINTFQSYYHYTVVTHSNREYLPASPFQQFFSTAIRRWYQ